MGSVVELVDLHCRGCRGMLGQFHLPTGAVVRIKCKCNVYTTVGGGGTTVTMLTRTRAEINEPTDRRDAA